MTSGRKGLFANPLFADKGAARPTSLDEDVPHDPPTSAGRIIQLVRRSGTAPTDLLPFDEPIAPDEDRNTAGRLADFAFQRREAPEPSGPIPSTPPAAPADSGRDLAAQASALSAAYEPQEQGAAEAGPTLQPDPIAPLGGSEPAPTVEVGPDPEPVAAPTPDGAAEAPSPPPRRGLTWKLWAALATAVVLCALALTWTARDDGTAGLQSQGEPRTSGDAVSAPPQRAARETAAAPAPRAATSGALPSERRPLTESGTVAKDPQGPQALALQHGPETAPDTIPPRAVAPSQQGPATSDAPALPRPGRKPPVAAEATVSFRLQLYAGRNPRRAEGESRRLAADFADLLKGVKLDVLASEVEGYGTFYRIRSGVIANQGEARRLCVQFEARGQDCLVVQQ